MGNPQRTDDRGGLLRGLCIVLVTIAVASAPTAAAVVPTTAGGAGGPQAPTSIDAGGATGTDPGPARPSNNSTDLRAVDGPPGEKSQVDLANYGPQSGTDLASADDQQVVVELSGATRGEVPAYVDRLRSLGATVETRHDRSVQVSLPPPAVSTLRERAWVERVRRPFGAAASTTSEGVGAIDADDVHAGGTTGAGVKVGVLDPEGFSTGNSEISSNVVATKSFDDDGGIASDGDHGTATAEVVVDTAPDAELYLSNFDTGTQYQNAVDWMQNQNVDVIVMSAVFFGQPYDGTGTIAQTADGAVADGIVWVNAAGNHAKKHWEGQWQDGDGDGTLNFTASDEANALNEGNTISAGAIVGMTLTWDEWNTTDQDYDLYVVDSNGNTVASSTVTQDGDNLPRERIQFTAPKDDTYHVVVDKASADGTQSLELVVWERYDLEHAVDRGSILSPATGDRVTGVGAFYYGDYSMESFSSHGPTNDGDQGVDVSGPDGVSNSVYGTFYGTSAATPHVGGVAALMVEANDSLSPSEVDAALKDTAVDIGQPGPDEEAGDGRVNASAAVASVASGDITEPTIRWTKLSNHNATGLTYEIRTEEKLATITADVTDDGTAVRTLTEGDFTRSDSGPYTYRATFDPGAGNYTATLTEARDAADNDGASGETAWAPVQVSGLHLSPRAPSVGLGQTTTVDVVLAESHNGVGGVGNLSVTLNDTSAVAVTSVDTDVGGIYDTGVVADGHTGYLTIDSGSDTANAGSVTLATITLKSDSNTPGEATLDLAVETPVDGEDGNDYSITSVQDGTITVEELPPTFEVRNFQTPDSVTQGDVLTVNATVENVGNRSGSQTVEYVFDGSTVGSKTIALGPGDTQTVEFTYDTSGLEAKSYNHEIASANDSGLGDVRVKSGDSGSDRSVGGDFQVTAVSGPDAATQGSTVTVEATVVNDAGSAATQSVALGFDGTTRKARDVTINAKTTTTVSFSLSVGDANTGDHTWSVATANDSGSATITVEEGTVPETSRTITDASPGPGETTTVTTRVTLDADRSRFSLIEQIDPNASSVTITNVEAGGNDPFLDTTTDHSVTVVYQNLEAGTTVEVSYEVTIPGDASHGDEFRINGSVSTDGVTAPVEPDTVTVSTASEVGSRSVGRQTVPPGETTTVTTELVLDSDASRLSLFEVFDPNFSSVSITNVDADGKSPFFSTETSSGVTVVYQGLDAGTTVEVSYEVTIPEDASDGDVYRIGGELTTSTGTTPLVDTAITVGTGSPLSKYTDGDGIVTATGLRKAISDWAKSELSTTQLRKLIRAWATGKPVA